jgi:uncharacterized protein (DUF433 family)
MSVSATTAVLAGPAVVHSDPDIVSGTPVFVGTRVTVRGLFDHLAAGDSLDDFLDGFPSVSREQAVAALWQAHDLLIEIYARPSR